MSSGSTASLIDVPVAVAVHTGERGLPRSYGARTYRDIRSWHDLDRGGHFTAWQVPETLADEVAAFAATLVQERAERSGPTADRSGYCGR
ncbi:MULTISPECIES: hypothetical protein [Curtobacterium]|uniref:hypothetical protein n=1 Tax=Curtobacterium TaxID=2034 RepID=UPI00217D4EB0|nr:hypothetical protein [Curtobacterium flaccumfaciens]MCS6582515.1 hypothetical protein [Curtobacterium flaccumfaciens pv. beticola]MCS6589932.1 hypothetical protein [Curtobacterium flaccumfaciens pv. flaccumfaciens]